ncbi:hypothetical protein [Fusobacterium perfoetens]|uniref:hypothetical protein n=1 Tax=Fusobacterium perfoetens TaxID=852 RepID=UPI00047F46CE|nr:hypothetical protein [Fusobacterium perfoetens]MCI6152125.1 hypothetical protein [Fusobacterium perfoetens]MDY3237984.1 hypothetical protein [Fusobacterium perfoetens]
MKKLLLGVASLLIGATTYCGVAVDLKEESTGTFGGTASLGIVSRGEIVDATGRFLLIVEPTVNAGADGTSLAFDHGQILIGRASELIGKFEAMVVTGGANIDENYSIVPMTGDEITAQLYHGNSSIPEEPGIYSEPKELHIMNAPEGIIPGTKENSTLAYQITKDSGMQGDIYRGIILSKIIAGDIPGTFLDRSAKLLVKVDNVDIKHMHGDVISNNDKGYGDIIANSNNK